MVYARFFQYNLTGREKNNSLDKLNECVGLALLITLLADCVAVSCDVV